MNQGKTSAVNSPWSQWAGERVDEMNADFARREKAAKRSPRYQQLARAAKAARKRGDMQKVGELELSMLEFFRGEVFMPAGGEKVDPPQALRKYGTTGSVALSLITKWDSLSPSLKTEIIDSVYDAENREADSFLGGNVHLLLEALGSDNSDLFRAVADAIDFRRADASHYRLKKWLMVYGTLTDGRPHHTSSEIHKLSPVKSGIALHDFQKLLANLGVPYKPDRRGTASPNYGKVTGRNLK